MELEQYIERIHNQPYNLFCNNCYHKAIRIHKFAKKGGIYSELIHCIVGIPRVRWYFPPFFIHMYTLIEGKKVDVTLSPEQEKKYFPNEAYKVYLPVRVG